jgi:hypothetical protein
MTMITLTDCCRLLAIDGKTLRRWLAQAGLPVQAHPEDARSKGLSREHLLLLANTHHRRLAGLPQEWPALAPPAPAAPSPELSPELITALQTLSALPAQIAALQQQVAELAALLRPQPPPPTVAVPRRHQHVARGSAPSPTKASTRSPRAAASRAKPPGPSVPVLPLIEYDREGSYVVICPKQGLLALERDTPQWFAWLATLSSFRFVGQQGRLTVHREIERLPRAAWRAHRSIRGHTYNLHLGSTQSLTIAALEQAAATLDAHLR